MTVKEAERRRGLKTSEKHGELFFRKIGWKKVKVKEIGT
jgi:hypothetical protein